LSVEKRCQSPLVFNLIHFNPAVCTKSSVFYQMRPHLFEHQNNLDQQMLMILNRYWFDYIKARLVRFYFNNPEKKGIYFILFYLDSRYSTY
jgi:hypothetical protein